MLTHRKLNGSWAECTLGERCPLAFHCPDVTPEQMELLPVRVLWGLLEAMDPPSAVLANNDGSYSKEWHNEAGELHRGYDLPARFWWYGGAGNSETATANWFRNGLYYRADDKPTSVSVDGTQEWYNERGYLHRVDGPAIVYPDGAEVWYEEDPADDFSEYDGVST